MLRLILRNGLRYLVLWAVFEAVVVLALPRGLNLVVAYFGLIAISALFYRAGVRDGLRIARQGEQAAKKRLAERRAKAPFN